MNNKLFILSFSLILCSSLLPFSSAQGFVERIEIPSSFNPVGSGARALGMGGAFIAIADDATAASWNPAGLFQLKRPEISLVVDSFHRREGNTLGTNPEASGSQTVSEGRINYLSAALPFSFLHRNMMISLNYQTLLDFNRSWQFPLTQNSNRLTLNQNVDYRQEGTLAALGIAHCIQVTPKFSFGVTLNIWEDGLYQNKWTQKTFQKGSGTHGDDPFTFELNSFDRYSLSGLNANLGLLWNITSKLTIGSVLKTPFRADLKHESRGSSSVHFLGNPEPDVSEPPPHCRGEKLDMPMSLGVGVACRFSKKFTASFDIYRTEWDNFVLIDPNGQKNSPITGKLIGESAIVPTHQVRLGAEYLFIGRKYVVPLRLGFFYDPAPAEGSPDDCFGFSLGSGVAVGRFVFDVAYQYRFGNNLGTSILQNLKFSQDLEEHTLYSSMVLHF